MINYTAVRNELVKNHAVVHVDIFINYLKQLETEKEKDKTTQQYVIKNKWFAMFADSLAVDLFNKVAKDNIFIDGDSVTLGNNFGKIGITYNYQAYKNIVLNNYPESIIDLQVVYDGDETFFKKESGKVIYEHTITSPFATNRKIIGAYCVIKNKRGEFLETLNSEEIQKMKNVAKTKTIWNEWESEMVKKSMIKRSCKTHFKDIVKNIEEIDNENYDLTKVNLTEEQNDLLARLEKILPEKIKEETRDVLKDRITCKMFAQHRNNIIEYITNLEKTK